ncbi:MAG: hypothetical protein QOE30_5340 [Mycobacterium sp.]|jgi:hypothetical protein|nr:hypothetical protein [Mycobacterium sp.]
MPPRVRRRPQPTVQEMANRIVETLAMHEWLMLEEDGSLTGYAYAHQFNSRAAYRCSGATTRSTQPVRSLLEFGGREAQQSAGDHELLNLLGALEDVHDLRITCPLL